MKAMVSGNVPDSGSFDPCRQWLGISALDLDDPKKLLGLASVDDPIRILQAAEVRLAQLQAVDAGPYEVARRALVMRIQEARDSLLAAASAGGMAATQPPPGGLAMPPSPTAAPEEPRPSTLPFPSMGQPSVDRPYSHGGYPYQAGHPPAPSPLQQPPFHQPLQGQPYGHPYAQPYAQPYAHPYAQPYAQPNAQPSGQPYAGPRPVAPYRRYSGSGTLLLLAGGLFTAVVGLCLMAFRWTPQNFSFKPSVPKQVAKTTTTTTTKSTEPKRHPLAARNRPFNFERYEPTPPPQSPDVPPQSDTPRVSPEPEPVEPQTPTPTALEPTTNNPAPLPAENPTPSSPPENLTPPPVDHPAQLARINDAAKRCLEALRNRDYDAAERTMKDVEAMAPDDREANRIAGWIHLSSCAKSFDGYRDRAISAIKPGNEFDVKTKRIAVVEATPQAITVMVAGQLKTWPRDDLPGAVVQAVVETWFDDSPANQLYLGAYHLTKATPNLEKAEACWSKAMIGGADASLLIPLLKDPVVINAGKP